MHIQFNTAARRVHIKTQTASKLFVQGYYWETYNTPQALYSWWGWSLLPSLNPNPTLSPMLGHTTEGL